MADTHVFHKGEPYEGHDFAVWGTLLLLHGSLQGEVHTAPFRCMHQDPGDIEVVPN